MDQLIALFKNDTFWALLTTGLVYLSGVWIRPLVVKLPKTNVVFRLIRLIHLGLNKIDPEGNASTKVIGVLCLAFVGLSQTASAVIGSYSETIYTQANYSVVDVGSLSYLRMTLTGGSGAITHKVIRSRYRRI